MDKESKSDDANQTLPKQAQESYDEARQSEFVFLERTSHSGSVDPQRNTERR